jgi:hypothetical protein
MRSLIHPFFKKSFPIYCYYLCMSTCKEKRNNKNISNFRYFISLCPFRKQPLQRHSSSPRRIFETTTMTKNENGHTTLQFFISPNYMQSNYTLNSMYCRKNVSSFASLDLCSLLQIYSTFHLSSFSGRERERKLSIPVWKILEVNFRIENKHYLLSLCQNSYSAPDGKAIYRKL